MISTNNQEHYINLKRTKFRAWARKPHVEKDTVQYAELYMWSSARGFMLQWWFRSEDHIPKRACFIVKTNSSQKIFSQFLGIIISAVETERMTAV